MGRVLHTLSGLAALAAILLSACGQSRPAGPSFSPAPLALPAPVSGASPFPAGCNPDQGPGAFYPGAAVEPSLAADPANPLHLAAAWQQDRWELGGGANGIATAASADGGRTWSRGFPAFTACSAGAAGTWDRATDPWLSWGPGGIVHQVALAIDDPWHGARQAIVASRSLDGGATWSSPVALAQDSTADVVLDKCAITADPGRPGAVYAVWDRLTGQGGPAALQTGPAWLGRSVDGVTWEPARQIYDPGPDAQTISNQIAVLPDGTLVDLLVIIEGVSTATPTARVAVLRSPDAGVTWDPPVPVADLRAIGVRDPRDGHPVRDGSIVPQIAADPASGRLYVVWQDARFSGGARDGIALSASSDGGLTWSPSPVQVNGDPAVQAFTPSVAVAASGRLAVSYYDFRADLADPALWTVRWQATSLDGGVTWQEEPVGGPFDLRLAPDVGGWFLGDYQGIAGLADSFLSLFSMSGPGPGQSSVFAGPIAAAAAVRAAVRPPAPGRAEQRVRPRPLAERLRLQRELPRARPGP